MSLLTFIHRSLFLRGLALAGSFALTAFVLIRLPSMGPEDSYQGVLLGWLAAMAAYGWAVSPRIRWANNECEPFWRLSLRETLLLTGIVAAAFVLRVWGLTTIPPVLGGDEASQGLEAIRVLNGEMRNPFTTGWMGVPTMSFFFNSISIRVFGPTIFGLRFPWVVVGTATVLATFWLVKSLLGTRLALVTAAFVAVYHYHIHFSRLGSNQILDPLLGAMALLFLCRAVKSGNSLSWTGVGITAGLGLYFYAGARLTVVVLAGVLLYLLVVDRMRFLFQHKGGPLIALGAFLVSAAPMIQFAICFPEAFNSRLKMVGIFQSGWLEQAMEINHQSKGQVLFDKFVHAVLTFNYYPDTMAWYGIREPFLDPVFGALFLLGLGYATLYCFNPRKGRTFVPMVAWWWGGAICGGMLVTDTPASQRLITLAVPTCFLVVLALDRLCALAKEGIPRFPHRAMLAIAFCLFCTLSLKTYFGESVPQRTYGGRHAEIATEIAPILNKWKDDHRILFVGAPAMYWGFATLPYLVPDAQAEDVLDPISTPPDPALVSSAKGVVYVLLPERLHEMAWVRRTFPSGTFVEIHTPVDKSVIAALYEVPPTGRTK